MGRLLPHVWDNTAAVESTPEQPRIFNPRAAAGLGEPVLILA